MARLLHEVGVMNARALLAVTALTAVTALLAGCAADSEEDASDESGDAITGGRATSERLNTIGFLTVTHARNNVGQSKFCTATMVAPNVVVTAASCLQIDGASWTAGGAAGWSGDFLLSPQVEGTFTARDFAEVSDVRVVRGAGRAGIAILKLDHALSKARPASLAATAPARGNALTIYGYGCTKSGEADAMASNKASFSWGSYWGTSLGCGRSADIGAAVFDGRGRLAAVLGDQANNIVFGDDVFVTTETGGGVGRQVGAAIAAWR